jgi:hypothetical protein
MSDFIFYWTGLTGFTGYFFSFPPARHRELPRPPSRAATSAIGCASGNAGRAQARRAGMKAKNFNRLRRMKK